MPKLCDWDVGQTENPKRFGTSWFDGRRKKHRTRMKGACAQREAYAIVPNYVLKMVH